MSEVKAAIKGGWKAVAMALEFNMDALLKQNRRLRAALEKVEWVHDDTVALKFCPWCANWKRDGHRPNCERQAALAPKEGE